MTDVKKQTEYLKNSYHGKSDSNQEHQLFLRQYSFHSDVNIGLPQQGLYEGNLFYHEIVDRLVPENTDFTYPVVVPDDRQEYSRAILLLHGLNERNWDKYWAWAGELAVQMQCPVILFPIAYHMNRSPKSWSDPRQLKMAVNNRQQEASEKESTFANVALSTRLGAHPEQFVYSGVQSFYDVWALMEQIQQGGHSLFAANTHVDLFAYSIGAFLSEILCIANPKGLFNEAKLFMFAGGPTFNRMQGTSRYIMDLGAFTSLLHIKRKRMLKRIYRHLSAQDLPEFDQVWRAFYGMLHHRKGRRIRKAWLQERGTQVRVVALKKDKVMPAKAIAQALRATKRKASVRMDIIDFPYLYTHENPFPLNDEKLLPMVNRSFDVVFGKAVQFYQQPFISRQLAVGSQLSSVVDISTWNSRPTEFIRAGSNQ